MSGGIAGRGRPGPAGPAGPMGPTGPQGPAAFSLAVGNVTAVPYGQDPSVENVGTQTDQVWDIELVTGATGVLTGPSPPTGADGTSLGQLYYCTANRTYYGLIELNENNNKWRSLMTQDSNMYEYSSDISWQRNNAETLPVNSGHVCFVFDEVRQVISVAIRFIGGIPIGSLSYRPGLDRTVVEKVRALASARGITQIPVPIGRSVNGVASTITVDLLKDGWPYELAYATTPGSGDTPGTRTCWKDGKLVIEANDTGAPGASTYGNEPVNDLASGRWTSGFANLESDPTYATSLSATANVVIPYA